MDKLNLKETNRTASIVADVDNIVESEDRPLFTYAIMVPLLALTAALGVLVYVNEYKYYAETTSRTITAMLFILSVIVTGYTFYRVKINARLIAIPIGIKRELARQNLKELAEEKNWEIVNDRREYLRAVKKGTFIRGYEVTIIFSRDEIAVNVRMKSGIHGRFPFTFGQRRKILKMIEKKVNAT